MKNCCRFSQLLIAFAVVACSAAAGLAQDCPCPGTVPAWIGDADHLQGDRWGEFPSGEDDYPRSAFEAGIGGTVLMRFTVGVTGRVTDCRVTRSSGNAELDGTTCRLILKRFRYRPARNAQGRPVAAVVTGKQQWVLSRQADRWIEPVLVEEK